MAEIGAAMIAAGERAFRNGCGRAAEREARLQAEEAGARHRRSAELEAERLTELMRSGDLLRRAEDLRALVARLDQAVARGERAVAPGVLAAWSDWALGQADALDPGISVQVLNHLVARSDSVVR